MNSTTHFLYAGVCRDCLFIYMDFRKILEGKAKLLTG